MTRLWIHECFRVFSDRLVSEADMEAFVAILTEKLGLLFDQTFHNICPNKQPPIFGDYMSADQKYEDIADIATLKRHMMETLDEYNSSPGVVQMDLVLFRDAIEHSESLHHLHLAPCLLSSESSISSLKDCEGDQAASRQHAADWHRRKWSPESDSTVGSHL